MEERPQQIIIKRVKKNKGAAAHGGSWKVAYADFVTAMMAFFLLLWLLSMTSDEKKAAVSEYFRKYSIFQESGSSAITTKTTKLTSPQFSSEPGNESIKGRTSNTTGKGERDFKNKIKQNIDVKDDEIVKKIRASIDNKMAAVRDQILVDVVDGGIRIQIIDTEGSIMFPGGSAVPSARAKDILKIVAANIQEIPGKIVVEGHTDATPLRGAQITNWELSSLRASAARRELENNGIDPSRIARVVGYADQELLMPIEPRDQRNRRISLIVLQPQQPNQ